MAEEREGRGFPRSAMASRLIRCRQRMAELGLGALWVSEEADVRYVTGAASEFWASPTRPAFAVVSASSVTAVVPDIWAPAFQQPGVEVKTWPSPQPADDGVSLLVAELVKAVEGTRNLSVGTPRGPESAARLPWNSVEAVVRGLGAHGIVVKDASGLKQELRFVKSTLEVAKVRAAARIASEAFSRLPKRLEAEFFSRQELPTERQVASLMRRVLLEAGADRVPYVACTSGAPSYASVVSEPGDKRLEAGDVLTLDTGCVWDGYYCDFNRNFAIVHPPSTDVQTAHAVLVDAAQHAADAARAGVSVGDLFSIIARTLAPISPQPPGPGVRFGHAVGLQLTELPSIASGETAVCLPGAVLALEPSVELGASGRVLVHEENVVVTADGAAEFLSIPAPRDMPVVFAGWYSQSSPPAVRAERTHTPGSLSSPRPPPPPPRFFSDEDNKKKIVLGFVQVPTDVVLDEEIASILGPSAATGDVGWRLQKLHFEDDDVDISEATFQRAVDNIGHAAAVLRHAPLACCALACTSMSVVLGPDIVDTQLKAAGARASTDMARAVVAALRTVSSSTPKIAVLSPYVDAVHHKVLDRLAADGLKVVAHRNLGFANDELTSNVRPDSLLEMAAHLARASDADVLFLACSAFRATPIIPALERATGLPVVASNQALVWHALHVAGADRRLVASVATCGRLFQTTPSPCI